MKKLGIILSLALIFGIVAVQAQDKKQEVKKSVKSEQTVKTTPSANTASSVKTPGIKSGKKHGTLAKKHATAAKKHKATVKKHKAKSKKHGKSVNHK